MSATLEHANFTVSDPKATAKWMQQVFGWETRWEGDAIAGGYTVHVGNDQSYLALYTPGAPERQDKQSYDYLGGLNHVAIQVDDLDATEARVRKAGFVPGEHHDYEPGRRFYFEDDNGVEFEVVSYN